jgi:hypothetical protein
MFRKRISIVSVVAVAAALSLGGCAKTTKTNTVRYSDLSPKAEITATVADLEVSEKKVVGVAKGKLDPPFVTKRTLIMEANANAIAQNEGADVLVGVTYFYEEIGKWYNPWDTKLTVTVTGYPAHYKNFRPKEEPKLRKIKRRPDGVIEHRIKDINRRGGELHGGPKGAPAAPAVAPAPAPATPEE